MTDTPAARDFKLEADIMTVERRILEIEAEIAGNHHIKADTWWRAHRMRQLKAARGQLARLNAKARAIVERS